MEKLKLMINNEKIKGVIAIVAAVIMWFAPDHVDMVIEALLATLGIQKLIIKKD